MRIEKKISRIRGQILNHLIKGRVVIITGEPGSGKSYFAQALMDSKKFRSLFTPMIDVDHVEVYRDVLRRGYWGQKGRFYFVDSYDMIKPKLIVPGILVTQEVPSIKDVEGREVVILVPYRSKRNPLERVNLPPKIVRVRRLPELP